MVTVTVGGCDGGEEDAVEEEGTRHLAPVGVAVLMCSQDLVDRGEEVHWVEVAVADRILGKQLH